MIQAISTEKAKFIEGEKRDAVDGLLKVVAAAEDREKAEQLFIETDTDDSGELDAQELLVLMQRIGIQMDLELIEEAINAVDVDGGGTMGLPEFFQLLKSLKKDALARLDDLCQERIMAARSSPMEGPTIKKKTTTGLQGKSASKHSLCMLYAAVGCPVLPTN